MSVGDITYDGINGANPDHMPQDISKATNRSRFLQIMIPVIVITVIITVILVSFFAIGSNGSNRNEPTKPEIDQSILEKVTRKAYFDI